MKERDFLKPPRIINEINRNLAPPIATVERIAETVGINKTTLYTWAKNDREFADALEIIAEVQRDDPFKTGTEEDVGVNSVIIALLLLETKDRYYKPTNT